MTEQEKRFHERLKYLEMAITEFYGFLTLRYDAAIREQVPVEVSVARDHDHYGASR